MRQVLEAIFETEFAEHSYGFRPGRGAKDALRRVDSLLKATWAALLGGGTRVDANNRSITNPLTGEPDAGDPPVRFGGRGGANPAIPTPIPSKANYSATP